ncbi:MAG: aryl-sulfate sulfotransferase [Anaerocolumna sp.]
MIAKRLKWLVISFAVILMLGIIVFIYGHERNSTYDTAVTYDIIEPFESLTDAKDIYDDNTQNGFLGKIEELKAKKEYTLDDALVIYNPFQTNRQSLYLYFNTDKPAALKYTIHVNKEGISDLTRTCYNGSENNLTTTHEYQLIGLIPDMDNNITLTLTYQSGKTETRSFNYRAGSLLGKEELILSNEEGESTQPLEDGFNVVSSPKNFILIYDNDGVLRSEIPIIEYRYLRLLFQKDKMYFSSSLNDLAEMNNLGMITHIYDFGKYELHHDYVFDDENNILLLGTDKKTSRVEDRILRLNPDSGDITEVLDLADIFPDYYKSCTPDQEGKLDWMHINTIQWLGDDSILISSRETSSILRIDNLYTKPALEYMLGTDSFWEGTEYLSYLYKKSGDFKSQLGQHAVTYVDDTALGDGEYYLYMFDNNIGISTTRPDYDWASHFDDIGFAHAADKDETSFYYKYLVNENAKTYELVKSFEVPYSGYMSSVQELGDNIIINSSSPCLLNEYDKENKLIKSFDLSEEGQVYRTFKYTFTDFYFYK